MRDQMLFGETQSGRPMFTTVEGTRLHGNTPCQSLFGAKLLPQEGEAPNAGIRPKRLTQSSV